MAATPQQNTQPILTAAEHNMTRRIQLRRDTESAWAAANPVLAQGEIGIDLTNRKIKIGDGSTAWNTLVYWDDGETDLAGYATEQYVDQAIGAITIPDVSNFITAEAIPFVPTDVADLTDTTNLLGGGTTVPSVDIESTAYKGFIARYGRVYDNGSSTELTVSKIVIFRESAYIGSGSTIDPTSSNDTFAVTGLGPSDVVAMFVLYGDTNGAKSLETLTEFVEAAVDTVLLDGGVEGQDNTIEAMRAAFYNNINTLTAAAGGLVENFEFFGYDTQFPVSFDTSGQGTGTGFNVNSLSYNTQNDTLDLGGWSNGSGYTQGDQIVIPGTSITYDGNALLSPDNDITITITEVNQSGLLVSYTVSGTLPRPPGIWPTTSIGDGGNDQYDTGNYINTNLANEISYNGGVIVDDAEAQFGPGSKYVVAYDSSVFGIFATGSSATTIRTSGGSGADGSSTTDTGALQSAGVNQQNAVTELAIVQGGLTFPDGTEQTTAFSRVKSTATGGRRIEEVAGYKEAAVTARTEVVLTTTASRSVTNSSDIWVDTASTTIDDVFNDYEANQVNEDFPIQFSIDNVTWYNYSGGRSTVGSESVFYIDTPVTYNLGDTIYFRYTSGGFSEIWWNKSDLPGGSSNFRGAVIDYHAYTGESTIIGTIHIVDDDGEDHISHQEVQSGSVDGENDDLWFVTTEGSIRYRRIDGEAKTLKVHWTAKVFYGSETYD